MINMELYFESYEFSNIYDFFRNFLNLFKLIFYFKRIKFFFNATSWHGGASPRGDVCTHHMALYVRMCVCTWARVRACVRESD